MRAHLAWTEPQPRACLPQVRQLVIDDYARAFQKVDLLLTPVAPGMFLTPFLTLTRVQRENENTHQYDRASPLANPRIHTLRSEWPFGTPRTVRV